MDFVVIVIRVLFSAYYVLLVFRALLPWFRLDKSLAVLRPVYFLTEPLLATIRKGLPPDRIGMDVAPFVALIMLWLLERVLLAWVF
ncbi:MAG: YggT family protein [Candidatus Saganbacteria bacterium]|nr:YggT family protein [Candidatus Saganbacteria bacterium]